MTEQFWTDERVAMLRELRAIGWTSPQMARYFGIGRGAVLGKARRLGIPTPNKPGSRSSVVPLPPEPVVAPPPEPEPEPPPVVARQRIGGCNCGGTRQPGRDQCAECLTKEITRQWAHRRPREPVTA